MSAGYATFDSNHTNSSQRCIFSDEWSWMPPFPGFATAGQRSVPCRPSPLTDNAQMYNFNAPSLSQSLSPNGSTSSSNGTTISTRAGSHSVTLPPTLSRPSAENARQLVTAPGRTRQTVATERRPGIIKPYKQAATQLRQQEERKEPKPPNKFIKFLSGVRPALQDRRTYNLAGYLPMVAARLYHMMTEVQRKPFIEAGARHLEDKRRQEPQPAQKRKSRNTEPLPDGVVGFDIIHPEFVADALRIMVRCAVCADLDPHIDDTRAKRGRYAKEDMCIAHKLAQLREHVWETWHVWGESGVIEELPPIFEEHEQQYTNADLSPFPVSCYLCAAP